MTTLTACLAKAREHGYTEDFRIIGKEMRTTNGAKSYQPEEVKVDNFYRFEGPSDPADSTILYVLQTTDGKKGTLSDAYGAYADPKVNEFMDKVEEISKVNPNPIRK